MMNSQFFHVSNHRPPARQRRSLLWLFWLVVLMNLIPDTVWAHPGHSLTDASWKHVLLSPDHLSVLLAVGAALFVVGRWVQRRLARRVLQWGGAVMAVASLLLLSLR